MFVTQPLLARSFWARSMAELKRVTGSIMRTEAIDGYKRPYVLVDFRKPDTLDDIKEMSDEDIGGSSTVDIEHVPADPSKNSPAHMRWYGSISHALPKHDPDVYKTGFAGFRNWDRKATILGRSLWNIDPYEWLALRVKGDGRNYFVNLQSETIVFSDLHQHRLYTTTPGEWETVMIRWSDFVRTNHGKVVEPQNELLREKVRTVGCSSTDRVLGPYELCVSVIWATNDPEGKIPDEVD